jgi:hypothetical protein
MHLFMVTELKEQLAKDSGNPCWFITLTCQDQGEDLGKKQLLILTQTDTARFRTDEFLDACQMPRKGAADTSELLKKLIRAQIIIEPQDRYPVSVGHMYPKGSTDNPEIVHKTPNKPLPVDVVPGDGSSTKNPFK